ncbi:ATP synthase F(0) complex subunit B1, partial [Lamprotornis superbus]
VLHTTRPLHTTQQSLAPVPPLPEKGGEVRHGLIPEEFFQFLYPKTGVTGPYMLGTGLLLYLLSKEIYVINHETAAAACILTVIVYGIKKFGPDVAAFADKLNEEKIASALAMKNEAIQMLQTAIEEEKKEQWRAEGRSYLFDAKRNNIAMLLETNYRERLLMVYNEVKKRLDYQVAMQNLKRQKEQDHMIQWVEKNVVQSITPQQQKESIAKCILDLKALSKSAHAALLFLSVNALREWDALPQNQLQLHQNPFPLLPLSPPLSPPLSTPLQLISKLQKSDAGVISYKRSHQNLQEETFSHVAAEEFLRNTQRQPGDCKQEENKCERLGCLELLAIESPSPSDTGPLAELCVDDVEDLSIQSTHDEQGHQGPCEEAEINHVIHPHHSDELAPHGAGAPGLCLVPAKHGHEPSQQGQRPAQPQGPPNSPLCSDYFISVGEEIPGRVKEKRFKQILKGILFKRQAQRHKKNPTTHSASCAINQSAENSSLPTDTSCDQILINDNP